MDEATQTNPVPGESNQSTHEMFKQRLRAERAPEPEGSTEAENEVIAPQAEMGEETIEARQPEGESEEGLEEQPDTEDTEGASSEESAEPEEGTAEYWQTKAEEAEDLRGQMQSDYQRKTQMIAEARHQLTDNMAEVQVTAEVYSNLAQQQVDQFNTVNWEQLKAQPEEYQRMQQAWQAASAHRDQMKSALDGINERARTIAEEAKRREAEVSLDILKTRVPEWSPEYYATLRNHAVEHLAYTQGEVDQITDWRYMSLIHDSYQASQNSKVKTTLKRKSARPPKGQRNRPLTANRNARGQFQTAEQAFQKNPGNRDIARDYFKKKLAAERSS